MQRVYRVQDASGRGPYRPGFSLSWTDPGHEARNPSIMAEFGQDIGDRIRPGHHAGCGFHSLNDLEAWFSEAERERLAAFGFRVVALDGCRVVARGVLQVVFSRAKPLKSGAQEIPQAAVSK